MKKLKKILLVDDDRVNNYLNEALLEELNISNTISIEENGERALQHLLEHCEATEGICPQLVILDHRMPVMDGLELMKELNERGFIASQQIIFILLGVHSTKEHILEFQKLGVQEYTEKPLSQQVVLDAYRKYFSTHTL
ncbi:response regulator [Rhodocytophaga aerolata]|uniref:Response regulator n=1 Tax=Rhodocytophaga aerolata TaxID=455078 RepID=A0ABT8RJT9_9BACT|nr:response regulator [Rhodocytophaga aerolata]MDO1451538.1 response regulator [Rhodocytophaga aerolata]